MRCQGFDILRPLAERRHEDFHDLQTEVEIAAEVAGRDSFLQVTVGGGHHTDINLHAGTAADPLERMPLEDAQKLRLNRRAHLADLVKKQRTLMGCLKLAGLAIGGAGEGALLVPEEFAFQKRLRQGCAVHADERCRPPSARIVDRSCDKLLAGAALTTDQHRGSGRRHPLDLPDDIPQAGTRADHPRLLAQSPTQLLILVG